MGFRLTLPNNGNRGCESKTGSDIVIIDSALERVICASMEVLITLIANRYTESSRPHSQDEDLNSKQYPAVVTAASFN